MKRKLTTKNILKIFDMRIKGFSLSEIGGYFDISRQFVDRILKRKAYTNVYVRKGIILDAQRYTSTHSLFVIERDRKIVEMYDSGMYTQGEVAAYMNCGVGTVNRAIHK